MNFHVKAVIGCEVPQDKLFREKQVRTSDHDFPETMEWHPETRAKLWTILAVPIDGFDAAVYPRTLRVGNLTCEMSEAEDGSLIAIALDMQVQLRSNALNKTKRLNFPTEFTLDEAKAYLEKRLAPVGLWDERKFGLWVVIT